MPPGFRYLICEPNGRKDHVVRTLAIVTEYLPFVEVASLRRAYRRIEPTLSPTGFNMALGEWLANDYNLGKEDEGRWPLHFAFWLLRAEPVGPFKIPEIMDFRAGRTGWIRVAADRIPEPARTATEAVDVQHR